MMDKTLTVIIPTWNRSRYLDENLSILTSYISRGLDFKILVCNNGSTDGTDKVLERWRDNPSIRIVNHPTNIMYDRNVASGYANFDTDYCFCLGDSKKISYESLEKIIHTINTEDIDALVIKTADNMRLPEKYYTDVNDLILDLGWILTNISSCVIPRSFIDQKRSERYYDSQFIHFGVFIDALCDRNKIKVKYDPTIRKEFITFPDEVQPHGWSSRACTIFVKTWICFIMSLPWRVTMDTKYKVILDHNVKTKHLSPGKFVYAKINKDNRFFEDYRKNRAYMHMVSTTPRIVYDIISIIPSGVYACMRPVLKRIPKYKRNIK